MWCDRIYLSYCFRLGFSLGFSCSIQQRLELSADVEDISIVNQRCIPYQVPFCLVSYFRRPNSYRICKGTCIIPTNFFEPRITMQSTIFWTSTLRLRNSATNFIFPHKKWCVMSSIKKKYGRGVSWGRSHQIVRMPKHDRLSVIVM